MAKEYGAYYNIVERIDSTYSEIDNDICTELRLSNSEYADMWRETLRLLKDNPAIIQITEGKGAISLSAEEHVALIRYLDLKNDMEDIERKQIYFRGHTDNYAYLKQIGGVLID